MCIRLLYESKIFPVFTASLIPKVIVLFEVRSCDICILYLYIVIISCSTCCLVGPVKATWVCASFDSNIVIISCSTCCLVGPTHVALTGPTRQQVLQLMMTRLLANFQNHVPSVRFLIVARKSICVKTCKKTCFGKLHPIPTKFRKNYFHFKYEKETNLIQTVYTFT